MVDLSIVFCMFTRGLFFGSDGLTIKNWLVVLAVPILKNDGVRQWVSDYIPYMKWRNKSHV